MNTTAPPFELHAIEKLREEELEEARAIQSVMLPTESLRAGKVMISHEFQPLATVGGDFLDYFEMTDGSFGLYVGDVCGKGLPAAMYAALAVGTIAISFALLVFSEITPKVIGAAHADRV